LNREDLTLSDPFIFSRSTIQVSRAATAIFFRFIASQISGNGGGGQAVVNIIIAVQQHFTLRLGLQQRRRRSRSTVCSLPSQFSH
jgi:hypothetical protein